MNAQAVTYIFFVGSNVLGLLLSFTIASVIVWGVSAHSPGAAHQCSGKRKSEMEDIVLNHICSCSIVWCITLRSFAYCVTIVGIMYFLDC